MKSPHTVQCGMFSHDLIVAHCFVRREENVVWVPSRVAQVQATRAMLSQPPYFRVHILKTSVTSSSTIAINSWLNAMAAPTLSDADGMLEIILD